MGYEVRVFQTDEGGGGWGGGKRENRSKREIGTDISSEDDGSQMQTLKSSTNTKTIIGHSALSRSKSRLVNGITLGSKPVGSETELTKQLQKDDLGKDDNKE